MGASGVFGTMSAIKPRARPAQQRSRSAPIQREICRRATAAAPTTPAREHEDRERKAVSRPLVTRRPPEIPEELEVHRDAHWQKDPEAALTWVLKDEIVARGQVYYAKLARGKAMFLAPRMIPYFHAVWGARPRRASLASQRHAAGSATRADRVGLGPRRMVSRRNTVLPWITKYGTVIRARRSLDRGNCRWAPSRSGSRAKRITVGGRVDAQSFVERVPT